VSALEFRLSNSDGSVKYTACVPVAALEPLILRQAAVLRQAEVLPPDAPVSYIVFASEQDPGQPVWARVLPPFTIATRRDGPRGTTSLFPAARCPSDVPIFMHEDVLEACVDWCRGRVVEQGGVLLGHLVLADGRLAAEARAFAPAIGADAKPTRLTFNAEAWSSILRFKLGAEERLGGDPLAVLGWVHSHPQDVKETAGTALFLSTADHEVMELGFAEPYATALVVDAAADPATPLAESTAAFGWGHDGISLWPRDVTLVPGEEPVLSLERRTDDESQRVPSGSRRAAG
jgi:hypothetical protein